jgi:succinate dehydrogenase hydrophobic anchor subunit
MEILIGICAFLLLIIVVYIVGVLPNLWINDIINPKDIGDVMERGAKVIFAIFIFALALFAFIGASKCIGEYIISWFK